MVSFHDVFVIACTRGQWLGAMRETFVTLMKEEIARGTWRAISTRGQIKRRILSSVARDCSRPIRRRDGVYWIDTPVLFSSLDANKKHRLDIIRCMWRDGLLAARTGTLASLDDIKNSVRGASNTATWRE